MKTLIIWLFEKYAYDYWCDIQLEREKKEFKEKHNLKDDEVEQAMVEAQNEQFRDAYDAGRHDGYDEAMQDNY